MQGISIHHTCTAIEYDRAATLIAKYTPPKQREALLKTLQSRPTTDAYYQVTYRVTDYHPLRWLRALGSQVEILLPWDLRAKMAVEIQNTWNLYQ